MIQIGRDWKIFKQISTIHIFKYDILKYDNIKYLSIIKSQALKHIDPIKHPSPVTYNHIHLITHTL